MSILSMVSNQSTRAGIRAVLAGMEGMGKTTLAAGAPRVLAVPLEQGMAGINVPKTPQLTHYDHVIQFLDEVTATVAAGQFPYQSIMIDSATEFERMVHQKTLESDPTFGKGNKKALTMESALGGYGKGYLYANELFKSFLDKCDILSQHYGINIILTVHVFSSRVLDPTAGEYNCMDLLLHSPKNEKTHGKREMLTQWADLVGYLHEPVFVSEGERMNKAVSAGQGRILGVSRQPSYVAKNRYGLTAPIPIPLEQGWNHLANAIHQSKGLDYFNRG